MPKKKTNEENLELLEEKKPKQKENKKTVGSVASKGKADDLLLESIEWSKKVFEQNKKIKRRLGWMLFGSYLKLLVVVVPIVIGIIYLPPLIESMLSQYQSLLGGGQIGSFADILSNISGATGGEIDINEILSEMPADQLNDLLKSIK